MSPLDSSRVIIGIAALFLSACADRATHTDRERLARVRHDFASEFLLEPSADVYIAARHLKAGCPDRDRAETLYRAFWLDGSASLRSDSAFVYLNLKDHDGKFCFQLFWDEQSDRFAQSGQSHY